MDFFGRHKEIAVLREPNWRRQAQLIVVYGRRRVGKTALIEHAYRDTSLWKFDGLEGVTVKRQLAHFQEQLALWTGEALAGKDPPRDWSHALTMLAEALAGRRGRETVVLFDEFQWMAGMRSALVALFKSYWDNRFSRHGELRFILCGSVSSFMVKKVIRSRALYGRISTEIDLKPLPLGEARAFFEGKRDRQEVIDIVMCLGGIPQYLKELNPRLSLLQNLNEYAFTPHGFFFGEYQRIFISHFGKNPAYQRILDELGSGSRSAEDLARACGASTGGTFTTILQDLELADLIERYSPLDRPATSRRVRYRLLDEYIHFHRTFIAKHAREILAGRYTTLQAFRGNRYQQWQGYAFERLCRRHAADIADHLRFSGIHYTAGSWFLPPARGRATRARGRRAGTRGAQVDLLFKRADRVLTVCEARYAERIDTERLLGDLDARCRTLAQHFRGHGIQRVLILGKDTPVPAKVAQRFDAVLRASEVFFAG